MITCSSSVVALTPGEAKKAKPAKARHVQSEDRPPLAPTSLPRGMVTVTAIVTGVAVSCRRQGKFSTRTRFGVG